MTQFTMLDLIGLIGVGLLLVAYGLTVGGKLDPLKPAALLLNLFGALGILASLWGAFNWSALVIETAWSLIALAGLARWFLNRKSSPGRGGGIAER